MPGFIPCARHVALRHGKGEGCIIFPWLLGTFLVSYMALAEPGKYDVPNVLSSISVEASVGFVQHTIIGALYGLQGRKRTGSKPEFAGSRSLQA
jgi:hypothetical protein